MKVHFHLDARRALLALVLLLVEVAIALWVHDDVIRPYIGDLLVVILIHFSIRAFVQIRPSVVAIFTFCLALLIECSQAMHVSEKLGIGDNPAAHIILGQCFDLLDVLMYVVGCCIAYVIDTRVMGHSTGR
ncbi:MAG TPA: DUF2809 domain-containing protein [Flavobacteriales bacterium]|nr:DUF2809 domain-containing protein [Flavobacteriales bacterium]